MGEVSGDSSSPLLQIPSPISPMQRAGPRCQAPTQLFCTHTHTYAEAGGGLLFSLQESYFTHKKTPEEPNKLTNLLHI